MVNMGFLVHYLVTILTFSAINLMSNAQTCTITTYNASVIKTAQTSCSTLTLRGLTVPAGETLDLSSLSSGTKVVFSGTTTWAFKEWEGPLIKVVGSNIQVTGESGHVLDGRGSLWWDGKGSNNGTTKPKFINVKLKNSRILSLNIKNTPVHVFSISGCDGLIVQNVTINNSAGDSGGGHNTDGFDVGNSNNVTIQFSTVFNQDDCLAVNSGTLINFLNNFCSGGHGISIGSVGGRSDNEVKSVTVSHCQVVNSDNGVRIKTISNATGSVSNVTYQDTTLSNIRKFGIVIEGDYLNGGPTGTPTDGVPIKGLTVKNVTGTVVSSGVNIYILVKGASNWHFSGNSVTGGTKTKTCTGIPSGAGVSC